MGNKHGAEHTTPHDDQHQFRVKLSPEYADLADDWTPEKCLRMAEYFAAFARQLHMRGTIAIIDRRRRATRPPARLIPLHPRRQALN